MKTILVLVLLGASAPALAWGNHHHSRHRPQIDCDGTLNGIVDGDVIVDAGDSCSITNAVISGDVIAKPGSGIVSIGGGFTVTVKGSIKIDGASQFFLVSTHVGGSVTVKNLVGFLTACKNNIDGNFTMLNHSSAFFGVALGSVGCGADSGDLIKGSLIMRDNHSGIFISDESIGESALFDRNTGGVTLKNNRVEDDLLCDENVPAQTATGDSVGGANTCGN